MWKISILSRPQHPEWAKPYRRVYGGLLEQKILMDGRGKYGK
jgi:hypothetical protein